MRPLIHLPLPFYAPPDAAPGADPAESARSVAAAFAAPDPSGDPPEPEPAAAGDPPAATPAPAGDPPATHGNTGKPQWWQRELASKTRQINDFKGKLAQYEERFGGIDDDTLDTPALPPDPPAAPAAPSAARAAAPAAPARPARGPALPQTADEFVRAVDAAADRKLQMRDLNSTVETAIQQGIKLYGQGKWDEAQNTLGALDLPPEMALEVFSTDAPHKVMYEFGANPELAQRIKDMPPHRRMNEMVKLAMKPDPAPPAPAVTGAPAPTGESVGNNARPDPNALSDDMSDKDWYAKRERQREARRKARGNAF